MSIREEIANNIVDTLRDAVIQPTRIKMATRQPFDFDKLSNAQFPAVLVRTADESREDSSIAGTMGTRMASINYELVCFVTSGLIDQARNNIIEAVEEGLELDRTRGGYARDTQLITIEVDEGSIDPVGGVILTVRVVYEYTRGTT